eukprot:42773_1
MANAATTKWTSEPMSQWNTEKVRDWILTLPTCKDYAVFLHAHGVNGERLISLTPSTMYAMGIVNELVVDRLLKYVQQFCQITARVYESSDGNDAQDSDRDPKVKKIQEEIFRLRRMLQLANVEIEKLRLQIRHHRAAAMRSELDDEYSTSESEYEETSITLETIYEEPWREECVRLQDLVDSLRKKVDKNLDDDIDEVASDDSDQKSEKMDAHESPVKTLRRINTKYSLLSDARTEPPILEGTAKKKSPAGVRGMRTWQRRTFRLFKDALCWYKDDEADEPLGVLPMFTIVAVDMVFAVQGRLDVRVNAERVVSLRFGSNTERDEWSAALLRLKSALAGYFILLLYCTVACCPSSYMVHGGHSVLRNLRSELRIF